MYSEYQQNCLKNLKMEENYEKKIEKPRGERERGGGIYRECSLFSEVIKTHFSQSETQIGCPALTNQTRLTPFTANQCGSFNQITHTLNSLKHMDTTSHSPKTGHSIHIYCFI